MNGTGFASDEDICLFRRAIEKQFNEERSRMPGLYWLKVYRVRPSRKGSSKQAISQALKDLEEAGVLIKKVIKLKPLHIEYS